MFWQVILHSWVIFILKSTDTCCKNTSFTIIVNNSKYMYPVNKYMQYVWLLSYRMGKLGHYRWRKGSVDLFLKPVVYSLLYQLHDNDDITLLYFDRYQKPADYKRKQIKLLTVKPLYLHLKVIFNTWWKNTASLAST